MNKNWRKDFFTIYSGQAISLISSSAVQFSIIWWITSVTGSALAITVASVVGLLPQAIIGPFAGVWVDRFNRKTVMIMADITVALGSLLLLIMCFFGTPKLWTVYAVLFIRAIGDAFHKPALSAVIPQFVPKDQLVKSGGFSQMISSACSMVGPMLGAFLMSVSSLKVAMIVDIVGALAAITTLSFVKIPNPISATGEKIKVLQDMKQGFKTIKANPALVRCFVPCFLTTVIFTPIGNMLPLMVKNYFQGTAWQNGFIQTVFSIGMLIAAGVIGVFGRAKKQFLFISLSISLLGVSAIIGGSVPNTMFWLFCVCIFFIGFFAMCFNIPFNAYVQKSVPEENLGKVMSLITSVLSFAAPLGMCISGPTAQIIGTGNWMKIAGILVIITGIVSYMITCKYDKDEFCEKQKV